MSNQVVKSTRNLFQGFTLGKLLTEGRAFVALAVIVIVFSSLSPNYLSISNVVVMTRHVGLNALLAIGMLLVILTAGIDLSVGSTVGLSGVHDLNWEPTQLNAQGMFISEGIS
jgi:erythritol transport system permease protein